MVARILIGDVFEGLRHLDADSIDCVVTSPPYWGLRDYGVPGQIGAELTMREHIDTLVSVFSEVRRVLKPTGTVWLNYGDSYAHGGNGSRDKDRWPKQSRNDHHPAHRKKTKTLKPKNLLMMPARIAIALQDDGWFVRAEIVWHKPNPMPESVKDRPTSAHEKLFLLTASAKYHYDVEAVKEPCSSGESDLKKMREQKNRIGGKHKALIDPLSKASAATNIGLKRSVGSPDGRNPRNVWTIAPEGYREAHFATFPTKLVEPCLKAGCPAGGIVLDPFGGAGTVGLVAERLGLDSVLIELNPEYARMAYDRINKDARFFK